MLVVHDTSLVHMPGPEKCEPYFFLSPGGLFSSFSEFFMLISSALKSTGFLGGKAITALPIVVQLYHAYGYSRWFTPSSGGSRRGSSQMVKFW